MAARHHGHGAAWVHVRPLRPPRTREASPDTLLSPVPIIGHRSPASSSFVLAATRLRALQLDPGHAAAVNQAAIGESHKRQNPKPGNHTQVTRPGQPVP